MHKTFFVYREIIISLFVIGLILSPVLVHAQNYGWRVIAGLTGQPLRAIEFVDSLHGWCPAYDRIYRTTDGGYTWQPGIQPSLPNAFFDLSFADTLHGWAVGTRSGPDGFIWLTTDGGRSWSEKVFTYDRNYHATLARGMAGNITTASAPPSAQSDSGTIVQTTDGGTTWTERGFGDSIISLQDIQFIDSLHGWMTGIVDTAGFWTRRGVFFRTSDGGSSWQVIDKQIGPFSFVDPLNGFAPGGRNHVGANDGNYFLRTYDRGLTWDSTFITDVSVEGDEVFLQAISFIDTLNGWLFGGTFYQGASREIILRTSDGGTTWSRESIGISRYPLDAIMLDRFHGWAVTVDGQVLGYGLLTSVL